MKEVRVCEAMKSPVGTLSDGTVLHQQDGGTKSRQKPQLIPALVSTSCVK